MEEVGRTLMNKLGVPAAKWAHLHGRVAQAFPEAWVEDFDDLIPHLTNHEKDRHVLAAAIQSGAQSIVTYNLKDFAAPHLATSRVNALSPDAFLSDCFERNPGVVLSKLELQAADSGRSFPELLARLRRTRLGGFTDQVLAGMNYSRGRAIGSGQAFE